MFHNFHFDHFVLLSQQRQLLADGKPVSLGARAFDVLSVLIENAQQVVTKALLFSQVWPGLVVEENNLQVHISFLRKILGAEAIATVAGRGYKFTRPVTLEVARANPARQPTSEDVRLSPRSLAVMPFANLSGDTAQEYFSDGLSEDVISKLASSPWLYVISRQSSFALRDVDIAGGEVFRKLGVRYVVIGSVRRLGDQIRVTAELVDGERNETLWLKRFDQPLVNLFAIQSEIADAIVSAVEPVYLRHEEQRSIGMTTGNVRHWDYLMRARWHFWRTSPEHLVEASRCLELALQEAPDDPACLALQAFIAMTRAWTGVTSSPAEELAIALKLATRAVRLDDMDAFAHFTLGTALSCVGQMPQAIEELQNALQIYPQFGAAAGELGRLLAFSGRTEEAMEYALQALDSSPYDPHASLWVRSQAIACFVQGDDEQALAFTKKAVAKRPDWFHNYFLLAACQAAVGDLAAGRESLKHGLSRGPYTMATLKSGHPFVNPAMLQRFVDLLRSVGWEG